MGSSGVRVRVGLGVDILLPGQNPYPVMWVSAGLDLEARHCHLLYFLPVYPILPSGCLLSLFLGPDGGPREGAICLPPGKITDATHQTSPEEESLPATPTAMLPCKPSIYEGLRRKASRTFSASRVLDATPPTPVPLSLPPSTNRPFPRTSRVDGYAYGYGSGRRAFSFRSQLGSNMSTMSYRRGSQSYLHRRTTSNLTAITGDGPPRSYADSELSFAQRLLMENENTVTEHRGLVGCRRN